MTRRNWVCPGFLLAVCQKRASMRRLVEPGLVVVFLLNFKLWQKFYFVLCCLFYHMVYSCCFDVFFEKKRGTYLTLTAVICHGWGCFMYLSSEALSEGSNWNWECVPRHSLNVLECLCDGSVFFGKFLFCGSFPRIKGTTVFGPCLCPSYGVESHIPLWAAWWKFKTCQSELFVSFREGFHVPTRFQLQSDNTVKDSCMQKHFFGWEGGLMCLIMDCICIIKNGLVLSWKDVSEHPRRFETGMQADWWWHCAKTVYSRFAITATCQWVTPMRTWMLCCR